MDRNRTLGLGALALCTTIGVLAEPARSAGVDPAVPAYEATSGVSGSLKSVGSDSMNNLMTLWAEGLRKLYPDVKVEIEGKGSSTAPPALTAGTAHFGPMSRPMKQAEVDQFEKKYGYKPVEVRTALDVLAVYVNKDNPIKGLTKQQVDAIFSKTRRCGGKPISLYGRNSASGTYGFFKEHALCNGDYRDDVKEQPGSSSVVQAVATDRFGLGYSGIGYKTADVRAVPMAQEGEQFFDANEENAHTGDYPLTRFLLLYVNKGPDKPLDPLRQQFLAYVLSRQGQEAVLKDGYLPLPAQLVGEERAKLGIAVPAAAGQKQGK